MTTPSRIPLWLKIGWTLWVVVWAACYWRGYGPQNYLWFCNIANFSIAAGLWLESRLVFSWQAVSVALVQMLWSVDLAGRLITGVHLIGGSEYMFRESIPLGLRLLSLYHFAEPPLLFWAIRRLGYDRRGWLCQCATAWVILPVSYLFGPTLDINWVWGPFDKAQTLMPPLAYLAVCLAAYPLLLYLPSHLALARVFSRASSADLRETPQR